MLKVEPTLPRNPCSSARTCKYFAKSVRMGINHIKQRQASDDGGIFFCSAYACVCVCEGGGGGGVCTRHTVRMIITTIINIIMCSLVGSTWRPEVVFTEFVRVPGKGASSLQLFTKSEHVLALLLCDYVCVSVVCALKCLEPNRLLRHRKR